MVPATQMGFLDCSACSWLDIGGIWGVNQSVDGSSVAHAHALSLSLSLSLKQVSKVSLVNTPKLVNLCVQQRHTPIDRNTQPKNSSAQIPYIVIRAILLKSNAGVFIPINSMSIQYTDVAVERVQDILSIQHSGYLVSWTTHSPVFTLLNNGPHLNTFSQLPCSSMIVDLFVALLASS